MADQKALKKRLKALMARPENQVCSDCPEKKPTWASLIAPPPGAPPGTEKIGAFCCLECSGSHRRLGVHISFVRSVNLDSWKEWEVRAMEAGGNHRVNSIFEAHLARSGARKPSNLASGSERERFIRDKYERRKYYNGDNYANAPARPPPTSGAAGPGGVHPSSRPGAPSAAARQRVASRQARMKSSQSGDFASFNRAARAQVAQAPVSAPVAVDLLDFGSSTTPAPAAPSAFDTDPFASQPPVPAPAPPPSTAPPPASDPFAVPAPAPVAPAAQQPAPSGDFADFAQLSTSSQPNTPAQPNASPAPTPASGNKSNADILALFGTPSQPSAFGGAMQGMGGMMNPQMASNANMSMGVNGAPSMQQQQQQSLPSSMPGSNPAAQMAFGNIGQHNTQPPKPATPSPSQPNPQLAMPNGNGTMPAMNPMQMQQMMMSMGMMNPQMMAMMQNMGNMRQQTQTQPSSQQQQQQPLQASPSQPQQQQMVGNPQMMMSNMNMNGGNTAASMPGAFGAGLGAQNGSSKGKPSSFNGMLQGMQQMNLNVGMSMPQGQPMAQASSDDFGSPMGETAAATDGDQKDDPFSSLGGMNAFR